MIPYLFLARVLQEARVVLFRCILHCLLKFVVFSLCIFLYCFVCHYQKAINCEDDLDCVWLGIKTLLRTPTYFVL